MKITFFFFLTSQGVPVIGCQCLVCNSVDFKNQRTRCSLMFQTKGKNIVIDIGTDFRQQILRERITRVDAVLVTHEHKDHTAGLDDIRPFNFMHKMDMPVFARKSVCDQLRLEYSYIFKKDPYPGAPRVVLNEIINSPFSIDELIEVKPIEGLHYKLLVFGFRIENFTYITDMNEISEKEVEKLKGTEVLVINALQKENHPSHFTLDEALSIIKKIDPKQAFLTHLSHRMGLHEEVEKTLPHNVKIAFDGLQYDIG